MAHVATIGTGTATTAVSSLVVTLTAGAAVGHTVIGGLVWESTAGSVPGVSVTDTRGNTWTATPDVAAGGNGNTTVACAIVRARITTALRAGDTITITITGGTRIRWCAQFDDFDDVNTTPLDKTAHNDNPGTSAALSTGVTVATAQAYELSYAVFGHSAVRTPTIPVGWSGGAEVVANPGSTIRCLQVTWRYRSTTGAEEGTLTLDTSAAYCAAVATYKATSAAPPVGRVSQVKLTVPQGGAPAVARVSRVAMQVPAGVVGVARVAQVKLRAPTLEGQAPYSGIKSATDGGALVNATISVAQNGAV